MIVSFLVFVVSAAATVSSRGYPGARGEYHRRDDDTRLPDDTEPLLYELSVTPDYDRRSTADAIGFDGEVLITIAARRNTSEITLNSRCLYVYVAYVHEKARRRVVDVVDIGYNETNERLTIFLDTELRAGEQYTVDIEYRGSIGNGTRGFYESKYHVPDGCDEWLLVTFLEPTGAREIFPCYDEPAYKTPYILSLTRPNDKFSRSNMPRLTTYKDYSTQQMREVFIETPPMATHQVSFIVSRFNGTSSGGFGSEIYAFTHLDYSDQIQYVSDEIPRLLKAMEEFTSISYKLPKLDLFAVPDFKSDAMGNWGLTTYREKYLLLNNVSSAKANELGLSIVQREIARQWFGNLVTCSWWDYLWLHDAFAIYFQYFAMNSIHPDWRMDHVFVIEQHQSALMYDQTPKRPITASVRNPVEINEVFYDRLSGKAAAFLRMLKCVTNDTIFQQSLIRYLKQNTYKSVGPEALFAAFEATVSEYNFNFAHSFTITNFMTQWTEQAGYPMINVTKVNDTFIVTQERFLIDIPDNTTDSVVKWFVGLTYTTQLVKDFENVNPIAWCTASEVECVVPAPRDPGWFIFNVQSTGFYRVNYDEDNWRLLIKQLKQNPAEIHVLNRAQLIDDSFNLARAGKLHYSMTMQLSSYLKIEDDIMPWYSAINGYTYLLERMRRDDTEYFQLKECISQLAEVIYLKLEKSVILENTSDHSTLTSWNAFSVWTCGLGNKICEQSAFEYYKKWQKGEMIPVDIRDAAFCVGIHVTNKSSTWEEMLEFYKTTKSPSEKQSAQKALACTNDKMLLSRYLNYIFVQYNAPIRSQDFKDVFAAVSSTPAGLDVLIDFLVQNLNRITEQLVDGDELTIFIYSICASKAALDNEIMRIQRLKNHPGISTKLRTAFNEKYNEVEYNLSWYTKYHETINVNVFCSAVYTTTEELHESTTYVHISSITQLSTTTLETKTTQNTSTDVPTPYSTESQTSQQTSSELTEISIETVYTSKEPSPLYEPSTKTTIYTPTESPSSNGTLSTEQPFTTVYTPTESTKLYSPTNRTDTTVVYTYTESSTSNETSTEIHVITIYTSTESSSPYQTSIEQSKTTMYFPTETTPSNETSTQLPDTTYTVSTDTSTEPPITTNYTSTTLSPINSTSTEQSVETPTASTEISTELPVTNYTFTESSSPYQTFSEQPKTTTFSSTESTSSKETSTQLPDTTYTVSTDTSTEPQVTTNYTSTTLSLINGTSTEQSVETPTASTGTSTELPVTNYTSTESSLPYQTSSEQSKTTTFSSTECTPSNKTSPHIPDTTYTVSTETSTKPQVTTNYTSTTLAPINGTSTEQSVETPTVSTGTSTELPVTNYTSTASSPYQTSSEQPKTTTFLSTESTPSNKTSSHISDTTYTVSTETSTEPQVTTNYTSIESSPPYNLSTEPSVTTIFTTLVSKSSYGSTTEQHKSTIELSTESMSTETLSTITIITTQPSQSHGPSTEQTVTTSYFSSEFTISRSTLSTDISTVLLSTTDHDSTTAQSESTTDVSTSTSYNSTYTEQSEATSSFKTIITEKPSTKVETFSTRTSEPTMNYSKSTSTVPHTSSTITPKHTTDLKQFYDSNFFWYYMFFLIFLITIMFFAYIICVYNCKYYRTDNFDR